MNAKYLIAKSKASLVEVPKEKWNVDFFGQGAKWMFGQMKEQNINGLEYFDNSIIYAFYGYLKYGVAAIGFLVSFTLLQRLNFYLLPLSIVVFYLVEVHFLFLFPLLIDKVENPISKSMEMTYKIGLWKVIWVVVPIGFYMLIGLFQFKNPLFNWYVGCLAIVIWYGYEVGGRV